MLKDVRHMTHQNNHKDEYERHKNGNRLRHKHGNRFHDLWVPKNLFFPLPTQDKTVSCHRSHDQECEAKIPNQVLMNQGCLLEQNVKLTKVSNRCLQTVKNRIVLRITTQWSLQSTNICLPNIIEQFMKHVRRKYQITVRYFNHCDELVWTKETRIKDGGC